MPRTNMDGKPIRRVLSWLLNRDVTDADLADALDTSAATYSRHKEDDNFPAFAELETLGAHFGISGRMLQIAFGWRGLDELVLLDEQEHRQWVEQGGGNHPPPPTNRKDGRKPRFSVQSGTGPL